MPNESVSIVVRLRDAARAAADGRKVATSLRGIGTAADTAGRQAARAGAAIDRSMTLAERGVGRLASAMRLPTLAAAGLGVGFVKSGLQMNASIQSSRERFRLFTNDVDGLMRSVQKIDDNSTFGFEELSSAAAMLGNSGVQNVPKTLQGIANAAAASGGGTDALMSIARAMSRIQAKGKLSMEEVGQLQDALAPQVFTAITKRMGVTRKELSNLGAEGISGEKAMKALTDTWTSGAIAAAAKRQSQTLGGQWDRLTGNMRKMSGAATKGLAADLQRDVLPAANRAANQVTDIFDDRNLAPQEKLRRARAVIARELGPIADDVGDIIERADLPEKLGKALGAAGPVVVNAAGDLGTAAVGGFWEAWKNSPGWAKVASALFAGKKANDVMKYFGRGLGGGRGGRTGPVANMTVTARRVTVIGGGTGADVDGRNGDGGGRDDKRKRPKRTSAAQKGKDLLRYAPMAGRVGGVVAAGGIAALDIGKSAVEADAMSVGRRLDLDSQTPDLTRNKSNIVEYTAGAIKDLLGGGDDHRKRGFGGTLVDLQDRTGAPAAQRPIVIQSVLKLDGREVAREVRKVESNRAARQGGTINKVIPR